MSASKDLSVLVLVPYKIFPAIAGGQKCAKSMYNYLAELMPVTIVSVNSNEKVDAKFDVLNILGTGKLRYINVLLFFKLKKIIVEKNITHLFIEHPYLGWLGYLLKRFCKIKLVVRSQNIEGERFKTMGKPWWKILLGYEKWVHKNADVSLFITEEDLNYGLSNFKLAKEKSFVATYGIDIRDKPSAEKRLEAKAIICSKHKIEATEKLLLFNGSLDYYPNVEALSEIFNKVNPILLEKNFNYKIIICGKNLPEKFNELVRQKNIVFAGFVEDINQYFLACDIFINPVIDGGGIKTKLVEALGFNLNAVSYQSGGIGVPERITTKKMVVLNNGDVESFTNKIIETDTSIDIQKEFYDHFYWGNIASNIKEILIAN